MNIYIEHNGNFYDYSNFSFNFTEYSELTYPKQLQTDKRDFEIGSRVYFQKIGWTEVVKNEDCVNCVFEFKNCKVKNRPLCGGYGRCDGISSVFKKLELPESQPEKPTQEIFYVYNKTMQNIVSINYATEDEAKRCIENKIKTTQYRDTFQILKVVAECNASVKVEWIK